MTDAQIEVIEALDSVNCLPGTFDKRFIKGMVAKLQNSKEVGLLSIGSDVSLRQNEWLYRLLYKYRRQCAATYEKYKTNILCAKISKS